MRTIEKRLCIAAILFVAIYLGAILLTLNSRTEDPPAGYKLESAALDEATRHIVMAQLLPPMLLLFTLTVCFMLIRRKQRLTRQRMEAFEEEHTAEQGSDQDDLR